MFQFTIKTCLTISALIIAGSNISLAKVEKKETKKATRQVASANYFSGARIGSSTVFEVGSLSEKDSLKNIAAFENFSLVKKIVRDGGDGRVALVSVDQGGSTDVGSVMTSSYLYLIFYQDGEMNNRSAAFPLGGINSFKIKNIGKYSVTLVLSCKNDELKDIVVETVVGFEKFEKSFLTYKAPADDRTPDFTDYYVPGKITTTKTCLPIDE